MPYICPVCQTSLVKHLPSQHKKSKEPGDSRVMMRARRHFLEDGFYQPMAKAVVSMIEKYRTKDSTLRILDMGYGMWRRLLLPSN